MTIRIRLHQAVRHACRDCKDKLPELLRALEAADHCGDPAEILRPALVYQEIVDAVTEVPEATFCQLIDCLRRDYGYSRKEVLDRFRRARVVFDQEKRNEEEMAVSRKEFYNGKLV